MGLEAQARRGPRGSGSRPNRGPRVGGTSSCPPQCMEEKEVFELQCLALRKDSKMYKERTEAILQQMEEVAVERDQVGAWPSTRTGHRAVVSPQPGTEGPATTRKSTQLSAGIPRFSQHTCSFGFVLQKWKLSASSCK